MSKSEREELLRHAMVFIPPRELALRLHVSPSALDEWISGKAPIPDGAMFVLLAVLNEITSQLSHQPTKDFWKPRKQGTNSR